MSGYRPQIPYRDREICKDELAVVYSALILADDDIPITADKINTILKAADVEVESIWPSLFARALQDVNIKELILGGLSGGGGFGGGAAGSPGGAAPAVEAPAEEEKKPVEEEEDSEDEDFGLSLFD